MPELTDEQYQSLLADQRIANLVKPVYDDPRTSKDSKRLLKTIYPQLEIPEYDLRKEMEDRFAAEEKRRQDEAAAAKQRDDQDDWKKKKAKAQADYGLTDDDMKETEKFMVDNNVANYEIAAGYRAAKNPKMSTPTSGNDGYWNFGKSDKLKEIATDAEGYARNEFMAAIARDQAKARSHKF